MDKQQFKIEWSNEGYCLYIDRPEVVWARDIAPILTEKSHIFLWNDDGKCIEIPPQRGMMRAFVLAFWKQARSASSVLILVC